MPRHVEAKLKDALARDDLDAVLLLLQPSPRHHVTSAVISAPDANLIALAKGKEGILALELAIEARRVDVVRRYIQLGVSMNARLPCSDWTPLQIAADWDVDKNPEMLKLILGPGNADPNLVSRGGCTALHIASMEGMHEVVREMLCRGADLHAKTRDGDYAHHFAAQEGHCDVLKTLVDAGANVNTTSGKGADCLRLAVEIGDARTVKFILSLKPRSLRIQATLDRLLFIAVCTAPHRAIPRMLLGKGAALARMTFENIPATTAVHAAVRRKKGKEILDDLLGRFGYRAANARDGEGFTPLFCVRGTGGDDMMRTLLRTGADPDTVARFGLTPLSMAAAKGSPSLCRILLDAGARLDVGDGAKRCSPLFAAALRGRCEMVKWLLKAGAKVNSPGAIAPPLIGAAKGGHLQAVKLLLSAGADVDAVDSDGFSALMWAVHASDKSAKTIFCAVASVLITKGRCNTRAVSTYGYTALHIAVFKNDVDAIRLLVQEGSDVNACTLCSHRVKKDTDFEYRRELAPP
jgi:ankyrin repeat protein